MDMCEIHQIGTSLIDVYHGIVIQKSKLLSPMNLTKFTLGISDSSLKSKINEAILKVNVDGTMRNLREKWFQEALSCKEKVLVLSLYYKARGRFSEPNLMKISLLPC